MNKQRAQIAVNDLLDAFDVSRDDPNFHDTSARFVAYLLPHFESDPNQILAVLKSAVFPSSYSGMVVETGIKVSGICPHHLLPVRYWITIGYLVSGKAIGLSKLVRLARAYASWPTLQEDITELLANGVESLLQTSGVGVVVAGKHSCMSARGVRSSPRVTTSAVRGIIKAEATAKEEFLMLAGLR